MTTYQPGAATPADLPQLRRYTQTELNRIATALKNVGGTIVISDIAPTSPSNGMLWFDTSTGDLLVWYDDGTSGQWIVVGGCNGNGPILYIGTYNQVTDVTSAGGPLTAASNFAAGSMLVLTVTGAFTTSLANLAGKTGNAGDWIISDGTVWEYTAVEQPGITDHGDLTGLADDDHPQYLNNARGDARYTPIGHTHDHGLLTGLADDDHPQYLNNARGDARYAPVVHTHVLSDITDAGEMAAVDDAPADGQQYARQNNAWSVVTGGGPSLVDYNLDGGFANSVYRPVDAVDGGNAAGV